MTPKINNVVCRAVLQEFLGVDSTNSSEASIQSSESTSASSTTTITSNTTRSNTTNKTLSASINGSTTNINIKLKYDEEKHEIQLDQLDDFQLGESASKSKGNGNELDISRKLTASLVRPAAEFPMKLDSTDSAMPTKEQSLKYFQPSPEVTITRASTKTLNSSPHTPMPFHLLPSTTPPPPYSISNDSGSIDESETPSKSADDKNNAVTHPDYIKQLQNQRKRELMADSDR